MLGGSKTARRPGPAIPFEKIQQVSKLLSSGMTNQEIAGEMKISHNTVSKYVDAMETMMWQWVIGMSDHGLVLDFKNHYDRIQARSKDFDDLVTEAKASKNPWFKLHALNAANTHDELCIKILGDAKLVREFKKLFAQRQSGGETQKQTMESRP